MKIDQLIFNPKSGLKYIKNSSINDYVQLIFVFGNRDILKKHYNELDLKSIYPNAEIVGCSTSGEIISNEIHDESIVITALYFEKTKIKVVNRNIESSNQSFKTGYDIVDALKSEDLKHVIILSEGLNINGSELSKGLNHSSLNQFSISGGLAGDQDKFEETVMIYNESISSNILIGIGIYGNEINIGYGSMGGWDAFGVEREITKSDSNVLFELDDQPALDLYKKYLGSYAENLPSSALLFPLSLKLKERDDFVVRTVLGVNNEQGSMVFAGDLPQGEYVRLMKANHHKLIDGANMAATISVEGLEKKSPEFALLISCVGRKLVLKSKTEDELDAIQDIFGKETSLTGFYSYGELCPLKAFDNTCEFHNQTMTITTFREL